MRGHALHRSAVALSDSEHKVAKEIASDVRGQSAEQRSSLPHVPQHMIGISIASDGFHELIAEQDDDSISLVLPHHRGRR